jgi:hypothetical protein
MSRHESNGPSAQILRQRVQELYRLSADPAQCTEVLGRALGELELLLEALQSADARLAATVEEQLNEVAAIEQSREQYRDLFMHAPLGYLVTSLDGIIRQASAQAEKLLGTDERGLIGRALSTFIPDGQRRKFRALLGELAEQEPRPWQLCLEPWEGPPFDAVLYPAVARAPSGRPQSLRWLVCAADQAGIALDEMRADRPAAQQHDAQADLAPLLGILADASELLAASGDVSAMLSSLAQLLVPALADGCIIDLDGLSGLKLRLVVTKPSLATVRTNGEGAVIYADQPRAKQANGRAGEASPMGVDALSEVPRGSVLRSLIGAMSPQSAIVTPLEYRDQILGSLTIIRSSLDQRYGRDELAVAEELARRIVVAVTRIEESSSVAGNRHRTARND